MLEMYCKMCAMLLTPENRRQRALLCKNCAYEKAYAKQKVNSKQMAKRAAWTRKWRAKVKANPEQLAKYRDGLTRTSKRMWVKVKADPERHRDSKRRSREKYYRYRNAAFKHYGNGQMACVWCGQSDLRMLCLDHINNDGAAHRKSIGSKSMIAVWACKNALPRMFQTLCFNCNTAKQRNGGVLPPEHKQNTSECRTYSLYEYARRAV